MRHCVRVQTSLTSPWHAGVAICSSFTTVGPRQASLAHTILALQPGNSRESDLAALTDDHPDSRVNKFTAEPVAWWWDAYEAMSARHGWNATL